MIGGTYGHNGEITGSLHSGFGDESDLFQTGLATVRHLEFGLFDMMLHSTHDPRSGALPQSVLDAARREVAVVPRESYDRFMHSFAHIFTGGYAAGYYSYIWAEVLSADAFSAFEEAGVLSPATGTSLFSMKLGERRFAWTSFESDGGARSV